IEISETERGDAETGSVKKLERSDAAGRHVPRLPIGVKNIGAMIPIEVADREIAHSRIAFIDLFPGRGASPGNEPVASMLSKDIRAPIAVKITEQEIVDLLCLGVEESPGGFARRGVIPGGAGSQEQIVFAIAVKIAHTEAPGGIGAHELVIVNAEFVNSRPAFSAANRIPIFILFVITLERYIVMELSQVTRLAAQVEILTAAEEGVTRNLEILPPTPPEAVAIQPMTIHSVHIEVLRLPEMMLRRRFREHEVVPGAVSRVRFPTPLNRVAV